MNVSENERASHLERGAMPGEEDGRGSASFNFYGPQYARFSSKLAAEMRREVYGEDIGQKGWRTAAEQAEIADLLGLNPNSRALDVACGAGGPSLALVEHTGCRLDGLDIEAKGIAYAQDQAVKRELADRTTFTVFDCAGRLPFQDDTFDAVLCIDAISHLRDRFGTLAEWARLLRKGGRLVFTDPFVLTGPVAKVEIDDRSAHGFHLLVPPGLNEKAINAAGLTLLGCHDRTAAVAEIAARWHAVRLRRASILEGEEGSEWFRQRQRTLAVSAELAGSGRLSRYLYVAEKPA